MANPFNPVMCSLAFAATVAVVDKNFFENRGNVVAPAFAADAIFYS